MSLSAAKVQQLFEKLQKPSFLFIAHIQMNCKTIMQILSICQCKKRTRKNWKRLFFNKKTRRP